jgi:isoquinoline 1-oxidoreductase alpha subunit
VVFWRLPHHRRRSLPDLEVEVVQFVVNGQRRDVPADGRMPLLWVVRDLLGLHGTKYSCGKGICGSCTVHVDGTPVRSCATPLSAVQGRSVTTIEGLSPDGSHPLQMAWVELNVSQCGYCQPGQIMSAAALLAGNPHPTERDIEEAMAGNLCRCGSYQRIKAAIARAVRPGNGGAR